MIDGNLRRASLKVLFRQANKACKILWHPVTIVAHSQHHGSAQYFHGIAAYADVGNALAFAGCPDVHLAWATALDPLANDHLLIALRDFVLNHPTGGAARRRSCGRVFAAVKKHSSSS